MRTRWTAAGVVLLGLATVAVGVRWVHGLPSPAPMVVFQLTDGRRLELARLSGHPVLVNFWSTSCAPCLEEMPRLSQLYRRLSPRGLEMVGVAMSFDRPDNVLKVSRGEGLPYPVALDLNGEVARAFGGIAGTPTSILVDGSGMVVLRRQGPLDAAKLEALIGPLL